MPQTVQDKAFQAVQEAYGSDALIVYKPEGLDYYIASGSMRPAGWHGIFAVLAHNTERMADHSGHLRYVYRGFDIKELDGQTFTWTDEHNFMRGPFRTLEQAQDSIDKYKRMLNDISA